MPPPRSSSTTRAAPGYPGGIIILKEHLARVRPAFLAARAFQRTSYLPGEIGQLDWWHTGVRVPVGRGVVREAFGLVLTLPHSGAHATVFALGRTVGDLCTALVGCLVRLGGVPEEIAHDNDSSIVAEGSGKRARLHPEVATLLGQLHTKAVPLPPRTPTSKGQVERTIGYLETSFLPLRSFASLADLQAQHDAWAAEVAFGRTLRRRYRGSVLFLMVGVALSTVMPRCSTSRNRLRSMTALPSPDTFTAPDRPHISAKASSSTAVPSAWPKVSPRVRSS